MKVPPQKRIIGYTDRLDLPEFGLTDVPCKIDTGAYTSSLHCSAVRLAEVNGRPLLYFRLYDPRFGLTSCKEYCFAEFSERRVRSSNGIMVSRYSIITSVLIFQQKFKVEFTLSFREKMRFPILLGRRFLRKRFLVDVHQKDLSYHQKTTP